MGWETDSGVPKPQSLPPGTRIAPAEVLNVVHCNCSGMAYKYNHKISRSKNIGLVRPYLTQ